MITLKQYLELIDYKITEGGDYYCHIPDTYCITSWNGAQDSYSLNCVFSCQDQTVYMVEVCDYKNNRAYRQHDPELNVDDVAWGEVKFTELDVDDDFIQKARAIIDGEDYDDRVSIPLELPKDELMMLFEMAHERDMTFNQFVVNIIEDQLQELQKQYK